MTEEEQQVAFRELAGAVQRRDKRTAKRLRERLFYAHFGLAEAVARKFRCAACDREDLLQAARCGLSLAVDKFDPMKEVRFSTFAYWEMSNAVSRMGYKLRGGLLSVPEYIQKRCRRVLRETAVLCAELGHEPTAAQVAARCNCTEQEVGEALRCYTPVCSMDAPLVPGEERSMADSIADAHAADAALLADEKRLRVLFEDLFESALTERQRTVLRLYFYESLSYDAIAKQLHISRERVRQIRNDAFSVLKRNASVRGFYEDFIA